MESLKNWLIEVVVKKMGPSAIRGAILGLAGFLAAKEGALGAFGIVYDTSAHIITISLDKLNLALVALLPAAGAAVIKLLNHQAVAVLPGNEPKP